MQEGHEFSTNVLLYFRNYTRQAIVTMERKQVLVHDLSNDAIFNYLK